MSRQQLPPITIKISDMTIIDSFDECTMLDISDCEYADLVSMSIILGAHQHNKDISVIKDSQYLNVIREKTKDESIGVLLLPLYNNTHTIIIIDTNREIHFK